MLFNFYIYLVEIKRFMNSVFYIFLLSKYEWVINNDEVLLVIVYNEDSQTENERFSVHQVPTVNNHGLQNIIQTRIICKVR